MRTSQRHVRANVGPRVCGVRHFERGKWTEVAVGALALVHEANVEARDGGEVRTAQIPARRRATNELFALVIETARRAVEARGEHLGLEMGEIRVEHEAPDRRDAELELLTERPGARDVAVARAARVVDPV